MREIKKQNKYEIHFKQSYASLPPPARNEPIWAFWATVIIIKNGTQVKSSCHIWSKTFARRAVHRFVHLHPQRTPIWEIIQLDFRDFIVGNCTWREESAKQKKMIPASDMRFIPQLKSCSVSGHERRNIFFLFIDDNDLVKFKSKSNNCHWHFSAQ